MFEKKTKVREDYFKESYEYELEADKVSYSDWIVKMKKKKLEEEEERKKFIEERKQELQNMANPYLREIESCEHLIAIFNRLKVQNGLVEEQEQTIQQVEKSLLNEFAKEDLNKKVQDGKLERVKTKAEREQESLMQIGGKKKKQPKKQKEVTVEEPFQLDFSTINKLATLKISPPLAPEDLDNKIKEIKAKMEQLEKEGEDKLKQEQTNIDSIDFEKEYEEQKRQRNY